jgi:cytochrome P450
MNVDSKIASDPQPAGPRFASDPVPLPAYLPPGTVKVTEWDEVIEALRSPHLLQEPPAVKAVHGGGLGFINGLEHRTRRRVLNTLVRPEPLQRYREEIVQPTVRKVMEEVVVRDSPGQTFRADLVALLQKVFLAFAAEIVGLKGIDSREGRDELQRVFRPLPMAHHVRFLKEGKEAAIDAALAAKQEYVERFVKPSLEAVRKHIARHSAGGDVDAFHASVLSLVAERADPAYENSDYAIADAIAFLIGAVDTSTHLVTHTVDELTRWFAGHPEDLQLRSDLDFLNAAMEETLRLKASPPVLGRIAAEDLTLANGKHIKQGQPVAIYHALANRDPSIFGPNADEFDPRRQPLRKVAGYGASFGGGSHMCIGQRVVVGDGQVTGSHARVLRELFEAGIQPDPESPPTRLEGEMAKFYSYPVLFTEWAGIPSG